MQRKLLFITHEASNSSYFKTLHYPFLAALSTFGFQIQVFRIISLIGSEKAEKNSEFFPLINVENFYLKKRFKSVHSILLLIKIFLAFKLPKKLDFDYVLFRSTLPSLVVVFLKKFKLMKFEASIYDSDGLAVDEYLEFNRQNKVNFRYIISRYLEFASIVSADVILTRSHLTENVLRCRGILKTDSRYLVLENGRDTSVFSTGTLDDRNLLRAALNVDINDLIVVYAGSIGSQYLPENMLSIFQKINAEFSNSKFLFLTAQENHSEISRMAEKLSIDLNSIILMQIDPSRVPDYLSISDIGFSFRKKTASMFHVKPLKIREYLLCGTPVVTFGNTGDTATFLPEISFDILDFDSFETQSFIAWVRKYVVENREQSRQSARDFAVSHFDLLHDVQKFLETIDSLEIEDKHKEKR